MIKDLFLYNILNILPSWFYFKTIYDSEYFRWVIILRKMIIIICVKIIMYVVRSEKTWDLHLYCRKVETRLKNRPGGIINNVSVHSRSCTRHFTYIFSCTLSLVMMFLILISLTYSGRYNEITTGL